MRISRPKAELVLTDEERLQLQSLARGRSLSAALSNRARLVLASAGGEPHNAIAARLGLTKQTVGKGRTRFIDRRITVLYDGIRPDPARTIDDERLAHLIKTTLHTKPANGSTHWSVRTVAAETGSPRPACSATCNSSGCSRIAQRYSSCPTTRSSSRSCAMWSACNGARWTTRW